MAKNRKNMSGAIRFGPAIKALLICSLFVASGVGYVWQKSVIADLERQRTARYVTGSSPAHPGGKLQSELPDWQPPGLWARQSC